MPISKLTLLFWFACALFVLDMSSCSYIAIADGRVPESEFEKLQNLAGAYKGSIGLRPPEQADEAVIERPSVLKVSFDEKRRLVLEVSPKSVAADCELHFLNLLKLEEFRMRLRGRPSFNLIVELDHEACHSLLKPSVAYVRIDPKPGGRSRAEIKIIKDPAVQGTLGGSERSVYYLGTYAND